MNTEQVIERFHDTFSARLVFGEPVKQGEAVVIPAAKVRGGGGGGSGGAGEQQGNGSGFGISASPVGAFIVKGENVTWRPAVNVNRVIAGAQLIAGVSLVLAARIFGKRLAKAGGRRRFRR